MFDNHYNYIYLSSIIMKNIKFFAIMALAIVTLTFTSCGGGKKSDGLDEVKVDNTTIGGKLSKYFSIVDKTYKYKKDIIDEVTVELTCIEPLPEDMVAWIGIEILDENGVVIAADEPNGNNEFKELFSQASPGQTVSIKVRNYENVEKQKPVKIRLSSILKEATKEESSSSNSEYESTEVVNDSIDSGSPTSSSAKPSRDWDAYLDSYEQYVDKYISLAKKTLEGDVSVLTEYNSLMEKAQELSSEMEKSHGEMSASQWSRYMSILGKMTQGMIGM